MKNEKLNNNVITYATEIDRGIDLGNGYTKFSGMRFASKLNVGVATDFGVTADEVHIVNYQGVDYTVGDGDVFLGEDRYYSTEYKVALFTALATSCKNLPSPIGVNLCVGLPLNNFKRHAKKLKNHLQDLPPQTITVDGINYIIDITKARVFPEGALAVIEEHSGSLLTIDVGSGTVNVVEWNGLTPVKETTIVHSMYNLYVSIKNHLNREYGAGLQMESVEAIIGKNTIKIAQKDTDISSHKRIIERHVDGLVGEIGEYFSTRSIDKIKLLGGGSIPLQAYFEKHYPEIQLAENSQYINSRIFDKVLELEKQN